MTKNIIDEKKFGLGLVLSAVLMILVYVVQLQAYSESPICCDQMEIYGWPFPFYQSGGFIGKGVQGWLTTNLLIDLFIFAGTFYAILTIFSKQKNKSVVKAKSRKKRK